MQYKITYKKSVLKSLSKLLFNQKKSFIEAFERIAEHGSTFQDGLDISPMQGKIQGYYRLRIGQHRAIFELLNNELILLVINLQPRGDVYKN